MAGVLRAEERLEQPEIIIGSRLLQVVAGLSAPAGVAERSGPARKQLAKQDAAEEKNDQRRSHDNHAIGIGRH